MTKKFNIEDISKFKKSTSQVFHDATRIKKVTKPLDSKEWPEEWKIVNFKSYPRFPIVELPKPELNPNISLKDSLYDRHSTRKFSSKALSLKELSNLLYFSAGIKGQSYVFGGERFYPSAGARYPLEIYPFVLNVKNLKDGIYHYYIKSNSLEEIDTTPGIKKSILRLNNLDWVEESAAILVTTAIFYRSQIKYGERGYRHILSEVGGLNQNIYLLSTALNIGCCSLGGYLDDGFNQLLDLESPVEATVGAIAIGKV